MPQGKRGRKAIPRELSEFMPPTQDLCGVRGLVSLIVNGCIRVDPTLRKKETRACPTPLVCSNPGEQRRTYARNHKSEYAYFQVILNNSEQSRNRHAASFTRQRSLVRTQHRPLRKSGVLQVETASKNESPQMLVSCAYRKRIASIHSTA